jgi:predicted Zn-dependent protease
VQVIRFLAEQFDAQATDDGATGFSRRPRGNKRGQRVFDPRLNMRSDPADPEGGYRPYFAEGHATPAMSWVENGVLKNLAYGPRYAMMRGKAYAAMPYSIRLSGGTTSIEQMIAQCQEGIYVNRFSAVDLVDPRTGLTTGVTRDGCFLIKNGKIDRSIKNFRFLESPFFFLNNIEALGAPERATFGYTPKSFYEMGPADWPRLPIIVPPMMVRDFNFSSLSDAI